MCSEADCDNSVATIGCSEPFDLKIESEFTERGNSKDRRVLLGQYVTEERVELGLHLSSLMSKTPLDSLANNVCVSQFSTSLNAATCPL